VLCFLHHTGEPVEAVGNRVLRVTHGGSQAGTHVTYLTCDKCAKEVLFEIVCLFWFSRNS